MSNQANFCMVYYYVPEDHDDPEVPNAFGISKAQENLTITQIKNSFPLQGEYYFRFKLKVNNNQIVWMDISNDQSKIPTYQGRIFMKVTRISWTYKGDQETKAAAEQKSSTLNDKNGQNIQNKEVKFSLHENESDFFDKQKSQIQQQQHLHKHALSDNSAPEKIKATIQSQPVTTNVSPEQKQQQQQQPHKASNNLLDMDLF